MLLKERQALVVGGGAGHHEEWQRLAVAARQGKHFLGMDLKERAAADRSDRVHALGMSEAQPRPLSARDHQERHFPLAKRGFSESAVALLLGARFRQAGQGSETAALGQGVLAAAARVEFLQLGQVEALKL